MADYSSVLVDVPESQAEAFTAALANLAELQAGDQGEHYVQWYEARYGTEDSDVQAKPRKGCSHDRIN